MHKDAGIGTSIDSFYEYLLKAYILFGDEEYLFMFREAYDAAMRYLYTDPWYWLGILSLQSEHMLLSLVCGQNMALHLKGLILQHSMFRSILSLDARARQDVAVIGSGFLKLDARARKDTKKIDHKVKEKAERLNHIAGILKDKAQSRLKKAASKHWSDGALEADLKRADFYAKQRAMKDALMALEFVKDIHDIMVTKMYNLFWKLSAEKKALNQEVACLGI